MAFILVFAGAGAGINFPATKFAIKKYTLIESRNFGYSFYYMILFISSALSGIMIEVIIWTGGSNMASFRWAFVFCVAATSAALVLTYFIREIDLEDKGEAEINIQR